MSATARLAYSHLGIGSAAVCGCHDGAGGFLRAYNEPSAACGTSICGGSNNLFYSSGSGVWILDLGIQPVVNQAIVRIGQKIPASASLSHNLKGSTTGVFGGEEVNLGTVVDGTTITGKYRYFKLTSTYTSTSNKDASPEISYFSVEYPRGYPSTGSLELLLDIDFTPENDGSWEIVSSIPAGASLTLTAKASNEGKFEGEETNVGAIAHAGAITVRKRFYKVTGSFASDATNAKTPSLKRIKANFPNG